MPLPTQRDIHVDGPLTNISIAYRNMSYIADDVFPIVPVMKQSDAYFTYDQSYWFRNEAQLRAPGTYSVEGGYGVSRANYFCDRVSFSKSVLDEQRDNADAPINLDREATEYVTDKVLLRREVDFADDFFATNVWDTDVTGGTDFTSWDDYAASDPLADAENYRDSVEALIGKEPNRFVIGKQVLVKLKWHPAIIDTIKYTQRGVLSEDLIAATLGFEKLLVGRVIQTTNAEGTAEASVTYSRVWGKHGLMLYAPDAPSLYAPAAGYTFVWQRVPSAGQYIKRHRDDRAEKDIIEANAYYDQKATSTAAGLFLSGLVA